MIGIKFFKDGTSAIAHGSDGSFLKRSEHVTTVIVSAARDD
jgi:hypothetical protein